MHSVPKCSFIYIYIMKPHRRISELCVEHTRTHLKNSPSLARLLYPFSSQSHSEPIPANPNANEIPQKALNTKTTLSTNAYRTQIDIHLPSGRRPTMRRSTTLPHTYKLVG